MDKPKITLVMTDIVEDKLNSAATRLGPKAYPYAFDISDPKEQRHAVIEKIPVGRFRGPEEFAHMVSFLISEKSGFITGELIDLNNGIHFD